MNKIIWKKIHNVLGLSSAIFLALLLVTGILLNHPSTWEEDKAQAIEAAPKDASILYLGKKDGLFISRDSGETWNEVPMLYPPMDVVDIKISESGQKIFVAEKWGRIISSDDAGKVWKNIPLPFDAQVDGIKLKSLSFGANHTLLLFTSHGWLTTQNYGESWETSNFDKNARSLSRTILTMHNGYFFGPNFVWLYDLSAIALLILILTGIILWRSGRTVS